jgi:hypothetical protein
MKILHWLILILLIIGLGLIAYGLFFNPSEVLEDQFSSIPEEELVLFYNRSYVLDPPLTWVDLKSLVVDFGFGEVAAVALGRADNVAYSPEIFSILLAQQGGNLNDLGSDIALFALKFYLEFADPSKKVYTWSGSYGDSLEEFGLGRIAMVFAREIDKEKFSEIDFGMSSFPKIDINQLSIPYIPVSKVNSLILKDMIEQAALGRLSPEEALMEANLRINE